LLESLRLCRNVVGNRVLARSVETIEAGVNQGMPMHEVMSRQPIFSKLILQMVMVGENTGQLGEALQNVADYYNDVIPRQIKRVFTFLEPAMMLFLIGVVAIVALSIFLPIASLLSVQ
jgi:type II secretory pathway component PulF